MSKELVISANRHETRVAIVEDDQVVEVYHQRENEYSLAGSIHKGRVTRVLPGMQSAFVEIGLDRDAFLYVSDFFEDTEEYDKIVTSVEEKVLKLDRNPVPPIVVAPPGSEATPGPAVESAASGPAEAAPAAVPAATGSASNPAPPSEQRWDDRERRGRRGRRRRGGRGGRGLPESKFYSPGASSRPPETSAPTISEAAPEPVPTASEPQAPVADDFFVLPGETLAKYRHPSEESEYESVSEEARENQATAEAEAEGRFVESSEEEPAETPVETAMAAVEEPLARLEDLERPIWEAPAEPVEEPNELDKAVALAESYRTEPEGMDESERAADPQPGAGSASDQESGHNGEPAESATPLAATQREQGERYPHRMSRRMRRRGRGGMAEQGRPGHHEARPAQAAPETRTAPAPAVTKERAAPSISDLLKEGQEIIVQIAKEPLGQKGARITSHIALPGRFLVYMPTVDHVGVSRKIPSDDERSRLKRILQTHRTGIPGGFIVRTAGEGHTEDELRADMMFLYNLWLDLRQKAERKPAPALLHHDLNVVERVLRDQLTSSFKSIWVDNEEVYEGVLEFVQRFQPGLVGRVKLYTRANPIFDEFNITSELEKALRPKVWLKSGGYIVINQTEALVAIDINTGKFVGKSNRLEDTIVKTNTDAVKEIVRQIRLRDLGGIIVVDFIDMDERKNRQKVMQALEEAMRADKAPYKILQFNDFGLVAITRKRVKQSLERTLCTPCPYCEGAGYVKSAQTVVGEILQEAHKIAKTLEGNNVMLRVSPEVAKLLKSNQNTYLQEIEEVLGRTVFVKSDAQLHQEKFDLG